MCCLCQDDLLVQPFKTKEELAYENYVEPGTVITPSYDPHCVNMDITEGCQPVEVISADRLRNYTEGAAETAKIANVLMNNAKTGQYLIDPEAWNCIWSELIENKKGPIVPDDRPGKQAFQRLLGIVIIYTDASPLPSLLGYGDIYQGINFSADMLLVMIDELNRLITKYSEAEWTIKRTANDLVRLLKEHLASVEAELEEINTGVRVLRKQDFLGPEERARMQDLASKPSNEHEKKAHSRYFFALEQKRYEAKRKQALHTRKSSKEVHDADFINILSDALKNIRTLESAGGMDQKRASELAERVEKVAQVVFPEGF